MGRSLANPGLCRLVTRVGLALAIWAACLSAGMVHAAERPLTVSLDENLAPFSFRNQDGQFDGMLREVWDLWSSRTGTTVVFQGMGMAQSGIALKEHKIDVAGSVFQNANWLKAVDFGAPYRAVSVSIFYDHNITRVSDALSLKGFTIAVKEGGGCADWLHERGITSTRTFADYVSMVEAAVRQDIRLFCMNRASARFFLEQTGLEQQFRQTPPLFSGGLRWAVAKGDAVTMRTINEGFGLIGVEELREIEQRWLGDQVGLAELTLDFGESWFMAPVAGAVVIVLVLWNFALRREVATRTERMEYLAHYDALTGLPNRALAADRLDRMMSYGERAGFKVAVLLIDLDDFMAINELLGHSGGDELIKVAADRLSNCVRDSDTVSRHGGDQFLVLLPDVHDTDAIAGVCGKIIDALCHPVSVGGHVISLAPSIGVAVFPEDGRELDRLVTRADTAVSHAKLAGRTTFSFFFDNMNGTPQSLNVRNDLRSAAQRGELVLHYQPQVTLAEGKIIGAEALVRWNHPSRGLLPPSEFIPVAETSGMIVPIGDWVLREACRQGAEWQRKGMEPMVVAVNLSVQQFSRGDIEQTVIEALEDSGLDPKLLELELTESLLIRDAESVMTSVRRLNEIGVRFSIDDFGTGYSSLSYLQRLNVDKLKLDRSFVRDVHHNSENLAIVRAIIQMARSLNLETIAEGVEDVKTLVTLSREECDQAQGFLISRPLSAMAFEQFVNDDIPRSKRLNLHLAVAPH